MKVKETVNTNISFYNSIQKEFSRTRQNYWKGWYRVGESIKSNFKKNFQDNKDKNINKEKGKSTEIKVLDLGCGNGRFLKFLKEYFSKYQKENKYNFKYLGVDTNKDLLKEVEGETLELDVFNNLDSIKDTYDVITLFGVVHHLPNNINNAKGINNNFRKEWFNKLKRLLNKEGLLIITFWDFRYKKKKEIINEKKNDYYLGWNDKEVKRYCHYYDAIELKDVSKAIDLKLIDTYKADGKTNDLNLYHIYKYN